MYKLPPASDEQRAIVDALLHGNVACDAVAGSGKTTAVMHIARSYSNLRILQFTYNRALRMEVNARAKLLQVSNLTVHTYHSFAVMHYDPNAYTDEIMLKIHKYTVPRRTIPQYDIIIVDEAQDMRLLFYGLVRKVIDHMRNEPKLVIMGDQHQGIYQFNGTDSRFLTLAPKIFPSSYPWAALPLSISYRITHEIADFINYNLCTSMRPIYAARSGPAVQYYRGNGYAISKFIAGTLQDMMNRGTKPDEIFVLAKTVRKPNSPVGRLENYLVSSDIKCYAPLSDEGAMNEDLIRDKIVFSSFHQSKGREREIVVVFDMDSMYYSAESVCPPELYVGATRARRLLIIVQGNTQLPFFVYPEYYDSEEARRTFGDVYQRLQKSVEINDCGATPNIVLPPRTTYSVTKFLRFILLDVLVACNVDRDYVQHSPAIYPSPPTTYSNEDVSDLNGLAIPILYEYQMTGKCTVYKDLMMLKPKIIGNDMKSLLKRYALRMIPREFRQLKKLAKRRNRTEVIVAANYHDKVLSGTDKIALSIANVLQLCNVYKSIESEMYHRLYQLSDYSWLSQKQWRTYLANLQSVLGDVASAEYEVDVYIATAVPISGRVDMISTDLSGQRTCWEFKCTTGLSADHKLQLLFYAYALHANPKNAGMKYKLFNICTGELWELVYDAEHAKHIVATIYEAQINRLLQCSDRDFVRGTKSYPINPLEHTDMLADLSHIELEKIMADLHISSKNMNLDDMLREIYDYLQ